MEHQVMVDVLVGKKPIKKNRFEESSATEVPVEDMNEPAPDSESSSEICCKFVSRYFLKAA